MAYLKDVNNSDLLQLIVNAHAYVHMKNYESVYLAIRSRGTNHVSNVMTNS